jgi:predicted DNA-binding transcriptional regulator AlpA
MSGAARAEVIGKIQASALPVKKVLNEPGVPRSTYYRWIKKKPSPKSVPERVPWNRLSSVEEETILEVARASPNWSPGQVAAWVTDNGVLRLGGFGVPVAQA